MLTTRSGDPDDGDNNKDPPEAPELQAAEPDDSTSDSKESFDMVHDSLNPTLADWRMASSDNMDEVQV
ncbi:hypothetical protein DPEC_G00362610 [Dallia pectoralis]|nr:hypothetical protein DPEC_G00368660 [Dallia pectoralis]KAJ7984002.1 hypothetical protein DPEC_G00367970 [Dallia pectoralis]KAJ7984236.1 hypothetical protein DPEC_G00362570 [Dallia pectoralis]KAJ7984240.1 hypothetical protein DPEC_G00362610 [Dallia pectoralis]